MTIEELEPCLNCGEPTEDPDEWCLDCIAEELNND